MPLACEIALGQARTLALPFDLHVRARVNVIGSGLELFDAHLLQEPAPLDFLCRDHLKTFDELRIPVVAFHPHQCAARFIHPQQQV